LAIKAANSSSMARHQFRLTRVMQTLEGTGDKVDAECHTQIFEFWNVNKIH
jgi:hypothetical protein